MHWITEELGVSGVHDLSFEPPVSAVLNVCELRPYVPPPGLAYRQLGFPDVQPFPFERVREAVLWADEQLRAGRRLLVHCAEGNSRSVTVAVCVLLHRGWTLEQAQRLVILRKPYAQIGGRPTRQPQYFQDAFLARWQAATAPAGS